MSPVISWSSFGKFARYVFFDHSFHSLVNTQLPPALSKPLRIPPMPANRSINVKVEAVHAGRLGHTRGSRFPVAPSARRFWGLRKAAPRSRAGSCPVRAPGPGARGGILKQDSIKIRWACQRTFCPKTLPKVQGILQLPGIVEVPLEYQSLRNHAHPPAVSWRRVVARRPSALDLGLKSPNFFLKSAHPLPVKIWRGGR